MTAPIDPFFTVNWGTINVSGSVRQRTDGIAGEFSLRMRLNCRPYNDCSKAIKDLSEMPPHLTWCIVQEGQVHRLLVVAQNDLSMRERGVYTDVTFESEEALKKIVERMERPERVLCLIVLAMGIEMRSQTETTFVGGNAAVKAFVEAGLLPYVSHKAEFVLYASEDDVNDLAELLKRD